MNVESLASVLGLISQSQRGEAIEISILGKDTPVPSMEPAAEQEEPEEKPADPTPPAGTTAGEVADTIIASCTANEQGLVSGKSLRPILMKWGVSSKILGSIWMKVDTAKTGKMNRLQIAQVVAAMHRSLRGEDVGDPKALDESSPATIAEGI